MYLIKTNKNFSSIILALFITGNLAWPILAKGKNLDLQQGSNTVVYPQGIQLLPENAFGEGQNQLSLLKDDQGRFYLPRQGYNNIGLLKSNQEYAIKVDNNVDLQINSGQEEMDNSQIFDAENEEQDFDQDGLTNSQEDYYYTDPLNSDTDNDGYLDGEEVAAGYSPVQKLGVLIEKKENQDVNLDNQEENQPQDNQDNNEEQGIIEADDADADGLFNEDEVLYSTDSANADTDDDGYLDGEEVANGYDPLNGHGARLDEDQDEAMDQNELDLSEEEQGIIEADDADADGLFNEDEVLYSTDSANADTDEDGFLDGEEVANGYDPLNGHGARLGDDQVEELDQVEQEILEEEEILADEEIIEENLDEEEFLEDEEIMEEIPEEEEFLIEEEEILEDEEILIDDLDADGLSNEEEDLYGTDLQDNDSDNDGYLDGEEIDNGYDPTQGQGARLDDGQAEESDQAEEEILEEEEILADDETIEENPQAMGANVVQVNPTPVKVICDVNDLIKDCDNDGVNNKQEVSLGTNPLKADSDADGYTDGQELLYNTDPLTYGLVKTLTMPTVIVKTETITAKTTTPTVVAPAPTTTTVAPVPTTSTTPTPTTSTTTTLAPAPTTSTTTIVEPVPTTSTTTTSTPTTSTTTTVVPAPTTSTTTIIEPVPTTTTTTTSTPTTSTTSSTTSTQTSTKTTSTTSI